jgi:Family of unknown function (DUF5681)
MDQVMSGARDHIGRFRPGSTGNAKGRPKTRGGVDAAVTKAFSEKVSVKENGKNRRSTKLDVTASQVANKSATGNLHAAKIAFDYLRKAEERAAADAIQTPKMTRTDLEIAQRVIARIQKTIAERANEPDGP